MFSCPRYDDNDSDLGEPNVVDITDDFENNSQKGTFDNNFENRRYTVQVKKSIDPKVMSNSSSFISKLQKPGCKKGTTKKKTSSGNSSK